MHLCLRPLGPSAVAPTATAVRCQPATLACWLCRGKRRSGADDVPSFNLPATRSRTRRSAGAAGQHSEGEDKENAGAAEPAGLQTVDEQQQQQPGAGAGGDGAGCSGRRTSDGNTLGSVGRRLLGPSGAGAAPTFYRTRGKLCMVVDGCLEAPPADCVSLGVRTCSGMEASDGFSCLADGSASASTSCPRCVCCLQKKNYPATPD